MKCDNCEAEIDDLQDGLCDDCQPLTCTGCGDVVDEDDVYEGECESCAPPICCGCGERTPRNVEQNGDTYCHECFFETFLSCDTCGAYVYRDDALHCESCEESLCDYCSTYRHDECGDTEGIHDYSYKPNPIFHGIGSRFFGVELEIDEGGESGESAQTLLALSRDETLFYIKHDGSLEEGMEIVSHPATYAEHMATMPWNAILKSAKDMGYKSHDTDTCGIHIHISRKAFGENGVGAMNLDKLITLFWRHWDEIVKFSRRDREQIRSWCNANTTQRMEPRVNQRMLGEAKQRGRYCAINLENWSTVEVRLFRGTLNPITFKAILQFMNLCMDIITTHGISWIARSTWKQIVDQTQDYPELMDYLIERNLVGE